MKTLFENLGKLGVERQRLAIMNIYHDALAVGGDDHEAVILVRTKLGAWALADRGAQDWLRAATKS